MNDWYLCALVFVNASTSFNTIPEGVTSPVMSMFAFSTYTHVSSKAKLQPLVLHVFLNPEYR
jgi:hypothetical protein